MGDRAGGVTRVTGVTVTWCEEGGEGEGEEILAGGRHMDQPKVVQEVLADLKITL